MELLGAANQFVAVHLRHQEIAEDQIERAGKGSLEDFERLLRVIDCDDAVTTGFEKEGADRENLFVVVYAENRLLGAHAVSLLPEATLWWLAADGPVRCVCWFAGTPVWWCSKLPRGPAGCSPSARDGSSAPASGRRQKSKALLSAPLGISAILSGERGCRTAGCERGRMPAQVAMRLRERKRSLCCEYSEGSMPKNGHQSSVRVQAARLRSGSRDCEAVKLLSTQIVRKTGESNFISNDAARCMQRRRQRFPTVRMVGWVGNSEVRAKMHQY